MAPPPSKKDSPDNRPEIQRMNTENMDIGEAKRILAEVDWEKEFSDKRVYNQKNHMIDKIAEVMKGAGATVKKAGKPPRMPREIKRLTRQKDKLTARSNCTADELKRATIRDKNSRTRRKNSKRKRSISVRKRTRSYHSNES